MPSAQDILDAINGADSRLDDVKGKLDQLIALGQYTSQALFQNDTQNDTMICILQQLSVNTCGIWNEAHQQTGLLTRIESEARKLADLFAATHAEAELAREEREHLQHEIEKCCPPQQPEPICAERPCPAPPPFNQPPPQTPPAQTPPQSGPPQTPSPQTPSQSGSPSTK